MPLDSLIQVTRNTINSLASFPLFFYPFFHTPAPFGMQDLNSPTRDVHPNPLLREHVVLTTGPPDKLHFYLFLN